MRVAILGIGCVGFFGLSGCSGSVTNVTSNGGSNGAGGSTNSAGGAANATGGATNVSAGGGHATGGATNSVAGAANATGGAASTSVGGSRTTGGSTSIAGGASGGASPGGATAASGGVSAGGTSSSGGSIFARMLPKSVSMYGDGPLIAAKPNGDVVVMGPNAPTDLFATGSGLPYLVEFDDAGKVVRKKSFPDGVLAEEITVDSTGATILVGQLYKTQTSFGGTPMSPVTQGYFLVKLDNEFNSVYELPIATDYQVNLQKVIVDAHDDIYVGLEATITFASVEELLLQKFSSAGTKQWSQMFLHDNTTVYPNDLAISSTGDLIACGSFNGTLTLGSTVLDTQAMYLTYRSYNGWYGWFSPETGAPIRAARFGGPTFDLCNGVDVTKTGAVHIIGSMSDLATFAGSSGAYSSDGDAFVAEMSANGTLTWLTNLNLPSVAPFDSAVGLKNETYVGGRLTRAGQTKSSSFVASVSATGQLGPIREYLNTQNGADHIVVSSTGAVWFTGTADGMVDFGTGPINFSDGQLYVVRLPAFF